MVKDALFGHINVFIIEKVGMQGCTLALTTNPYQRLTIDKDVALFKSGSIGANNVFRIDQLSEDTEKRLWTLSVNGNKKDGVARVYLGVTANGSYAVCSSIMGSNVESTNFYLKLLPHAYDSYDYSQCFTEVKSVCPLKQWQTRRFVNEGYIHLPRIVDSAAIIECVRYLNHHLGRPGAIVAGGVQTGESLGKFDGHLSNCSAVRAVFKQTERILDTLLGVGGYDNSNISGQIAFRFPELTNRELTEHNRDEIASSIGTNLQNFTLLYSLNCIY